LDFPRNARPDMPKSLGQQMAAQPVVLGSECVRGRPPGGRGEGMSSGTSLVGSDDRSVISQTSCFHSSVAQSELAYSESSRGSAHSRKGSKSLVEDLDSEDGVDVRGDLSGTLSKEIERTFQRRSEEVLKASPRPLEWESSKAAEVPPPMPPPSPPMRSRTRSDAEDEMPLLGATRGIRIGSGGGGGGRGALAPLREMEEAWEDDDEGLEVCRHGTGGSETPSTFMTFSTDTEDLRSPRSPVHPRSDFFSMWTSCFFPPASVGTDDEMLGTGIMHVSYGRDIIILREGSVPRTKERHVIVRVKYMSL